MVDTMWLSSLNALYTAPSLPSKGSHYREFNKPYQHRGALI
jgi:hypothetical protein